MSNLKKAWIRQNDDLDLYSLSIESTDPTGSNKLHVREMTFPEKDPKRHTICITYMTLEDIHDLYEALGEYLYA